jgi:hypothetical protein
MSVNIATMSNGGKLEDNYNMNSTEMVPPNQDLLALTKMILGMNQMILEQNAQLLKYLSTPLWRVGGDSVTDKAQWGKLYDVLSAPLRCKDEGTVSR